MDYLTEEEQVERIRAFWKEYGLAIVGGIVIAIVVVLAWRYYQGYETKKNQAASLVYTTLINSALSKQEQSAIDAANELKKNYTSTPYAGLAALWLAKNAVDEQQYATASQQLNWVLTHASMNALRQTARLRLAQIDLQQNQPQQALQLLKTVNDRAYLGMIDETRGDAYLMLNQIAQANSVYQQALKEMPDPDRTRPILAMKLASLPVSSSINK